MKIEEVKRGAYVNQLKAEGFNEKFIKDAIEF